MLQSGQVDLGFQQLSELMHLDAIDVLGPLPDEIQIESIFAGAICSASRQPEAGRKLLAYLGSERTVETIRRHGMRPV